MTAGAALTTAAAITDWVGRVRHDDDEVSLAGVRRLAATLDRDPAGLRRGDPLPESWYAILFAPLARHSALTADGHPATGDFLPPLGGMRRMFGGRRSRFTAPLHIGDAVARCSTITAVAAKDGRSGPLTVVTITHAITGPAGVAVTEEQDIVYRAAAAAAPPGVDASKVARKDAGTGTAPEWSNTVTIDAALAFRYSALTFNAHRIHYDLPYARHAEGYPALLVNGGLTVLLLIETAREHLPQPITGYAARAVRPLFVGDAVTLHGRRRPGGAELWATAPDGGVAYRVDLTLTDSRP